MRLIAKCESGHVDVVPFVGVARGYAESVAGMLTTTYQSHGCGLCGAAMRVDVAGFAPGERVRILATSRLGKVRDVTPDRVIVESPRPPCRTIEVLTLDEDDIELIPCTFEIGALVRVDDGDLGHVRGRDGTTHVVEYDDGSKAYVDGALLTREL